MVKVIQTEAEFTTALESNGGKVVLVDFYADWCGPCLMFAPTFEALANEWPEVVFLKVNTDDFPVRLGTSQYSISALPTFVFFKNGDRVDSVTGASKPKVVEKLKAWSG